MVEAMSYDFNDGRKVHNVKRSTVWILIIVFLVLLLTVGLLSGLLSAKKAREDAEKKYEKRTGGSGINVNINQKSASVGLIF